MKFVQQAVATGLVVLMGANVGVLAQQGTGAMNGVAQGMDKTPLRNYTVQVRNVQTGQLAGSTTSSQAGEFAFAGLQPGSYAVEIVDVAGKVVGLSSSVTVTAGATVTVAVSASAVGAITAAAGGGFSLLGLGPLASVAVAGAASAAAVTAVVATRDGKITVCHVQGTARQTIEVGESARDVHMGHGDQLGACPASPSR
jgi:hypothetical protein